MDNIEHIASTNINLPFYNVLVATAQYLKTLDFIKPFNGAIYTYPRKDNPNTAIPAIFIYFSSIRSSGSALMNIGTMRIDVMINPATNNRENIPIFKHSNTERMIQSTVFDNRYKSAVTAYCPYLTAIGNSYVLESSEDTPSFRLSIPFEYPFLEYERYCRNNAFDSTGEPRVSAIIKEIDISSLI